jgi:hypothetical protein
MMGRGFQVLQLGLQYVLIGHIPGAFHPRRMATPAQQRTLELIHRRFMLGRASVVAKVILIPNTRADDVPAQIGDDLRSAVDRYIGILDQQAHIRVLDDLALGRLPTFSPSLLLISNAAEWSWRNNTTAA